MAVRTQLERTRTAIKRRTARRNIIARTARIWSRLYKQLVPELKDITRKWIERLIKQAEQEVSAGYIETFPEIPSKFTQRLKQTLRESYAQGWWLNHLYVRELEAAYTGMQYKGRITLSDMPTDDELRELLGDFMSGDDLGEWESVIPQAAIDWLEKYTPSLAGNLSNSVLEGVREIMRNSLQTGSTLQERMKGLRESASELSKMAEARIESIARTEITRADTLGRLSSMKSNEDVIGVEFSAVMDDRTTEMCSSRHGLVMRLDDPRLPENTPPIHVSCRSILLSCTVYEYPDGLLTSHEFEEVPAGTQRPEDIQEVMKVLAGNGEVENPALEIADVVKNIHPTEGYRKAIEKEFDRLVERISQDSGQQVAEDELRKVEAALQELMRSEDTHIGIRFSHGVLDSILNDGRFKSTYETGSTGMVGGFDAGVVYARLRLEHRQMSYPYSHEPWTLTYQDRPIYSALIGYKNPSEVVISSGNLTWAGDVTAIMKHEVKSYATMTGGDSANWTDNLAPAPLLAPNRYIFNSMSLKKSALPEAVARIRKGEALSVGMFDAKEYAEVQIHGMQATVSNIQHLIFGRNVQVRDDQAARLKALGITWSREGEDIIH